MEVAIAEAVDGEFAVVDGLKELEILRVPRAQGADTFVVPRRGLADVFEHVCERNGGVNGSEGVEVAVVGGLSDLGPAGKISQTSAHGTPGFGA